MCTSLRRRAVSVKALFPYELYPKILMSLGIKRKLHIHRWERSLWEGAANSRGRRLCRVLVAFWAGLDGSWANCKVPQSSGLLLHLPEPTSNNTVLMCSWTVCSSWCCRRPSLFWQFCICRWYCCFTLSLDQLIFCLYLSHQDLIITAESKAGKG